MFRSDKYKFYFCHIQKTGGTSIKKALLPYANPDQLYFDGEKVTDGIGFAPHIPMSEYLSAQFADYFKFAFVRNPWQRHASLFKFLQSRDLPEARGVDFKGYIERVCRNQLHTYSKNQIDYVRTKKGIWLVDFIGRFETLQESFDHVCGKCGLPQIELPHFKDQGPYDYKIMYTNALKRMIADHHKEDIKEFGYVFEKTI